MNSILQCESLRLAEQSRLDKLKTARERNKRGQFATPPGLSLEIAKYAWDKVRRREEKYRFLDPAVGTGSFFAAFRQVFPADRIELATGIELDAAFADAAASIWRPQGLRVVQGDFTRQPADAAYNLILTNPPYVRHHHILAEEKQRLSESAFKATGLKLSGLAGLYCHFLLIAHQWLAENGLAAWLIPSEFMDVNYGNAVKRYLSEYVTMIHVHRFFPSDVQFDDALVSSAIVIYAKRKPSPDHFVKFSSGGRLSNPTESCRVPLELLRETPKWSALNGTNGNVNSNGRIKSSAVLGDLFAVKRGIATGNNAFFVLPKNRLHEKGIPLACVKPIFPSPRFLREEIIEQDDDGWPLIEKSLALVDCRLSEEEILRKWPSFWEYLQEGMQRNIHCGYLTSRRCPWYSQERRDPAPFLCTYMGRSREQPFRFIWNKSKATAANVYLMLYPRTFIAENVRQRAARVFEALRSIEAQEFFTEGRVYGGGLHKMEPSELMRLPADGLLEILELEPERQLAFF